MYVDGVDNTSSNNVVVVVVIIVRSTVVDRVTNPVAGVENNPLVRRSRPKRWIWSPSHPLVPFCYVRFLLVGQTPCPRRNVQQNLRAVSKHRRVARVFRPCNTYCVL